MWLKRRALVQWCNRKNTLIELELRAKQSENSSAYDVINEVLGKNVKTLTEASNFNVKLEKDLKDQGKRVLSNIFARKIPECFTLIPTNFSWFKNKRGIV